ncbi:MAG: diguanylate cyclase [Firmicutes bacterium]|nr:diguanylate cyclase [Bacillota bacterium]
MRASGDILWLALIYGIPCGFIFHWGLDTWHRNPHNTAARLIAALHFTFLLMLFAVFAIQVLPIADTSRLAIYGIGTLGVLIASFGTHVHLRALGWIERWPRGLGVIVSYMWIAPGLWTLLTRRNLYNVSVFYHQGLWTKPYYNGVFHIAMGVAVVLTGLFAVGLGWRARRLPDGNERGILWGLFWGVAILTGANAFLGAWLPMRTPPWMPPYPYLVGMLAWLVAVRYTIVRYELLPSRLERYRILFDASPLPIVMADANARIIERNPAAAALLGHERGALLEMTGSRVSGAQAQFYRQAFIHRRRIAQWQLDVPDVSASKTVVVDGDYITVDDRTYSILVLRDMTEADRKQVELTQLAYHDGLTGLVNAVRFQEELETAIGAALVQDTGFSVVMIDLDNFKDLNDTWGHQEGNHALVQVADRLRAHQRPGDVIGRLGGDEFAVLLPGVVEESTAQALAGRILTQIHEPLRVGSGFRFSLTASLGVSRYPDHGRAPDALMRAADQAMYAAKREGKNRVCLYDQVPEQDKRRRGALPGHLGTP